jgi:2-polyprenyl-3-methyl-5-hydroxy-6-metoxy-1,4-benzoquinol methylase
MHNADIGHEGIVTAPETADAAACWACGGPAAPDSGYPAVGLYRCARCGLRFSPAESLETVRGQYDESYFAEYGGGPAYDADERQRRQEAAVRLRWMRAHGAAGALLEVGSAGGYFVDAARRAGFAPVLGIEPGEEMARAARERFGADVVTGVLEEVDLGEARWDVACAWHVVEHIAEPRSAVDRLVAGLKPGGQLFVEVPNIDSARSRQAGEAWPALYPGVHVAHYGPRSLRALLEAAGLQVEGIESIAPAAFLPREKALGPRGIAYVGREALVVRAWPTRPHPWRHEFLRAVARRPA